MGKFFNQKVKGNRNDLIKWGIIGGAVLIIVIIFIAIAVKGGGKADPVLDPKDKITIELGGSLPETKDLFDKFENFDIEDIQIDDSNVNYNVVGTYMINISAQNGTPSTIICDIVDTTAPVLILKDVAIMEGAPYKVQDFVESCVDNSQKECVISFYTEAADPDGNIIDYSSFTEPNTYQVQIIATDEYLNKTDVQIANLTIIKDKVEVEDPPVIPEPTNCEFGNLTYPIDRYKYPIGYLAGDEVTGCAISIGAFNDPFITQGLSDFINKDIENIQPALEAKLDTAFPNESADMRVCQLSNTVLNTEQKGIVGFEINVKIYIFKHDENGSYQNAKCEDLPKENLKVDYYLKRDGARHYIINEYELD